jgi:pimeloyl-ACP methyl ester carboxylesterase
MEGNDMPHDHPSIAHAIADIEPSLRLHFASAGDGPRTIVLLHGFPQIWWEWHRAIPDLVAAGFRVVVPDYRGAGHSSRPLGGYDKLTMAGDIHRLLRDHLKISGPLAMVGHDIGLMVAYAYAQAYRDQVSHLVVMDAPLPGTAVFDRLRADPGSGNLPFTVRATCRKCWLLAASGPICRRSSMRVRSTRPRLAPAISIPMSLPIPRRARCVPALSFIGRSTAISTTTGQPCSATAS